MSQQAAVVTIADLKSTFGTSNKGSWELATLTGSDNKKYKTFDAKMIEDLIGAIRAVDQHDGTRRGFESSSSRKARRVRPKRNAVRIESDL